MVEFANRSFAPLVNYVLCDCDTALGCFIKLNSNSDQCFMFESIQGGEHWARYSFIGLPAEEYYTVRDHTLRHYRKDELVYQAEVAAPLKTIEALQHSFSLQTEDSLPRFAGGLVGYFGYECARYVEPCLASLPQPKDKIGAPDIYLLLCTDLVVYDNLSNRVSIICHYELQPEDSNQNLANKKLAEQRFEQIRKKLQSAASQVASLTLAADNQLDDKSCGLGGLGGLGGLDGDYYRNVVKRCKEYILAGDIFQVVPSQRATFPFTSDAISLYRALRLVSPSPYMYFLKLKGLDIVGASPETMVRLEDGELTVRPIAGTARRGATNKEDEYNAAKLLADPKERAEHNMLVDLARNDLGRIAASGSVVVTQYMQVEYFSHVMHLVSSVNAKLTPGLTAIDALSATIPAGTLSGAPKIRAMEIINQLEPVKRGVYSGAIGYLDWRGNMDTAIPIRTFVIADGKVHIQAGGGIVADSDPEAEWQETLNKRRALFSALKLATSYKE